MEWSKSRTFIWMIWEIRKMARQQELMLLALLQKVGHQMETSKHLQNSFGYCGWSFSWGGNTQSWDFHNRLENDWKRQSPDLKTIESFLHIFISMKRNKFTIMKRVGTKKLSNCVNRIGFRDVKRVKATKHQCHHFPLPTHPQFHFWRLYGGFLRGFSSVKSYGLSLDRSSKALSF